MAGLRDLEGLFQLEQFTDSKKHDKETKTIGMTVVKEKSRRHLM